MLSNSDARPEESPVDGHRDRLRHRMERDGINSLRPWEVLELVLHQAVPRQDLSDMSRQLVERFGSVGAVFDAGRRRLMRMPGMTRALAEWIALTGELMHIYYTLQSRNGIRLRCYSDVSRFLKYWPPCAHGGSMILFADYEFNLIRCLPLRQKLPWWDTENVRLMVEEAIGGAVQYAYLVLDRGGKPRPLDDEEAARLCGVCDSMDAANVDLVDCLLAGDRLDSLRMQGRMPVRMFRPRQALLYEGYAE